MDGFLAEQRSHSAQKASNDALVLSLCFRCSQVTVTSILSTRDGSCLWLVEDSVQQRTHTHTNSQPFHTLSDLLLPSVRFQTNPTLDCPDSVSVSLISSQPWLPIRLSIPSPLY